MQARAVVILFLATCLPFLVAAQSPAAEPAAEPASPINGTLPDCEGPDFSMPLGNGTMGPLNGTMPGPHNGTMPPLSGPMPPMNGSAGLLGRKGGPGHSFGGPAGAPFGAPRGAPPNGTAVNGTGPAGNGTFPCRPRRSSPGGGPHNQTASLPTPTPTST